MSDWSAELMLELGVRHATLEARCDLEGTMATLIDDAVYELHPMGLVLRGSSQVRRYYENLMGNFIPNTVGYELLSEWVSESSVAQEYEIEVRVDGGTEKHRVIGILFADDARSGKLGGERVYGGEQILRLMFGELYDELDPL